MAVDVSEPWLCCVTPIAQSTHMLSASAIMCATLSSVSTESPQVCEANSMVKGASFFLYSSSPFTHWRRKSSCARPFSSR